MEDFNPNFDR